MAIYAHVTFPVVDYRVLQNVSTSKAIFIRLYFFRRYLTPVRTVADVYSTLPNVLIELVVITALSHCVLVLMGILWGADKSLARPGRNTLGRISGTRAISTTSRRELSSSLFPCKARRRKEIHAILTGTLDCFLPSRAKDLSAPLYYGVSNPGLTHEICAPVRTTIHSVWFIPLILMRIMPSWFFPSPMLCGSELFVVITHVYFTCAVINAQLPVY